jgi:hypothetical protein
MDLNKEILRLKRLMEDGKISLLPSMADSLKNVRKNPNGTVVEDTVDASVRALLLAIKVAEDDKRETEEFDDEFISKIKSMGKKEREEFFLNMPREGGAEYKEIYVAVIILEDLYYALSNLTKEAFKSDFVKKIIELGGKPEDRLKDYILLEIKKFYELASKDKEYSLPEAPKYWKKIKDIRDDRIAHAVKKSDFKTNRDVANLYYAIDKIGLDKIVEDFKLYARKCLNIVCEY